MQVWEYYQKFIKEISPDNKLYVQEESFIRAFVNEVDRILNDKKAQSYRITAKFRERAEEVTYERFLSWYSQDVKHNTTVEKIYKVFNLHSFGYMYCYMLKLIHVRGMREDSLKSASL